MNKILLFLIASICLGETPPPRDINARLYDKDNNGLTSTLNSGKRSLDVNITSALGSVTVSNFPATQAVTQSTSPWVVGGTIDIGNFPANFGVTQVTSPWVISGTVNIGTPGALALDATLSALSAKFGTLGQTTMAGSAPVVIASNQSAIPVTINTQTGRTRVSQVRNVYSSTNVTTAAYVELVASTADTINNMYIFDSSGQTLVLAVGAASSEVDQFYITPGGNGSIDLAIPAGSRVSVKAISANATAGELSISFLK